MEIFIFGLIFTIILIPILFFLPIRLHKKEKLFILFSSFLLAELAFWINKYISLWQVILLVLLFAAVVSYVFETRFRPRFINAVDTVNVPNEFLENEYAFEDNKHSSGNSDSSLIDDKDSYDYDLGQDAIDRLLSLKAKEELSSMDELPESDTDTQSDAESQSLEAEPQLENESLVSTPETTVLSEEEHGIIEDFYNNPSEYSDFEEVSAQTDMTDKIAEVEDESTQPTEESEQNEDTYEPSDFNPQQEETSVMLHELLDVEELVETNQPEAAEQSKDKIEAAAQQTTEETTNDNPLEEDSDEEELLQIRAELFEELENGVIINEMDPEADDNESDDNNESNDVFEEIQANVDDEEEIDVVDENELEALTDGDSTHSIIDELLELTEETETAQLQEDIPIINDIDTITTDDMADEETSIEDDAIEQEEVVESLLDAEEAAPTTNTNREMLYNLLSFINNRKKSIPPEQYEQYLLSFMDAGLDDQDYYALAQQLIEHYILHNQHEKLSKLFQDLSVKFANYPVLQGELTYLTRKYG